MQTEKLNMLFWRAEASMQMLKQDMTEIKTILDNLDTSKEAIGERLLTADDVAKKMNIGAEKVRRMARDGQLTCIKIGKQYRFPLSVLNVVPTFAELEQIKSSTGSSANGAKEVAL